MPTHMETSEEPLRDCATILASENADVEYSRTLTFEEAELWWTLFTEEEQEDIRRRLVDIIRDEVITHLASEISALPLEENT